MTFPNPLRFVAGWIIDLISNDRELNVEPIDHPYYPGEISGYTGNELKHEDWCNEHWDCCGYCKCGAQDDTDFGTSTSSVPTKGDR